MFQWSSNRRGSGGGSSNAASSSMSSSTSTYPGQRAAVIQGSIRPPEHSRAQHLDSYLNDSTLQRSTRRIPPGDATYDTVFQTVQGDTLILRVTMPNEFPTMTLAGILAHHAWLEPGTMKVTGYAPLQSERAWRDSRLLLGAAVHQVVQEFQVRPPRVQQILDPNLQKIQSKPASSSAQREQQPPPPDHDAPPDYAAVLSQAPSIDMPTIPSEFEELNNVEREELDRLLENELDFQTFCNTLSISRTLQAMTTSVVDDNAKAAEENMSHEKELNELHQKAETLQKQLKEAVREFHALEMKQDKLCRPPDRRKIVKELTRAKKQAFDKSEQIAETWLENDAENVDSFVQEFLEERKLHHLRGAKLEILELAGR